MSERFQPQPEETQPKIPSTKPKRPTRAQATWRRAGAAITLGTLAFGAGNILPDIAQGKTEHAHPTPEVKHTLTPTFDNPEAQRVAEDLHLEPGRYFETTQETMDAIDAEGNLWTQDSRLLPIFPEAIMKHADIIESAAESEGIPANFLATIGTIESNGIEDAHSNQDANGMFQIVPRYHLQRFINHKFLPPQASLSDYNKAASGRPSQLSISEYQAAFNNPEYSAKISAEILHELITGARSVAGMDDHPIVFALAGAGYNGGADEMRKGFWDMPGQSQDYYQAILRFEIDAAVAERLRRLGQNDDQVRQAMYSPAIDARALALRKLPKVLNQYEETYAPAARFVAHIEEADPAVQHDTFEATAYAIFKQYNQLPPSEKLTPRTQAYQIRLSTGVSPK